MNKVEGSVFCIRIGRNCPNLVSKKEKKFSVAKIVVCSYSVSVAQIVICSYSVSVAKIVACSYSVSPFRQYVPQHAAHS
jgi:hypothetical protein